MFFGYGLVAVVWFAAMVIIAWVVWSERRDLVSGTAIVLTGFKISEDPSTKVGIDITGRAAGVVAWVATLVGMDVEVRMTVTESNVSINVASLSGFRHVNIPLHHIGATICGYQRSIIALAFAMFFTTGFVLNLATGLLGGDRNAFEVSMAGSFSSMILAAISILIYFLSKRVAIGVETEHRYGVIFKRSVIENVSIDLQQALAAITVLNARVLATHSSGAPSNRPASQGRTDFTPSRSAATTCPTCSSMNPAGTRFCENCGSGISV